MSTDLEINDLDARQRGEQRAIDGLMAEAASGMAAEDQRLAQELAEAMAEEKQQRSGRWWLGLAAGLALGGLVGWGLPQWRQAGSSPPQLAQAAPVRDNAAHSALLKYQNTDAQSALAAEMRQDRRPSAASANGGAGSEVMDEARLARREVLEGVQSLEDLSPDAEAVPVAGASRDARLAMSGSDVDGQAGESLQAEQLEELAKQRELPELEHSFAYRDESDSARPMQEGASEAAVEAERLSEVEGQMLANAESAQLLEKELLDAPYDSLERSSFGRNRAVPAEPSAAADDLELAEPVLALAFGPGAAAAPAPAMPAPAMPAPAVPAPAIAAGPEVAAVASESSVQDVRAQDRANGFAARSEPAAATPAISPAAALRPEAEPLNLPAAEFRRGTVRGWLEGVEAGLGW